MNKYSDISESARDVLMEIGNIGTGNAVTALSSMINHRIEIERPNVKIMKFEEVPAMPVSYTHLTLPTNSRV